MSFNIVYSSCRGCSLFVLVTHVLVKPDLNLIQRNLIQKNGIADSFFHSHPLSSHQTNPVQQVRFSLSGGQTGISVRKTGMWRKQNRGEREAKETAEAGESSRIGKLPTLVWPATGPVSDRSSSQDTCLQRIQSIPSLSISVSDPREPFKRRLIYRKRHREFIIFPSVGQLSAAPLVHAEKLVRLESKHSKVNPCLVPRQEPNQCLTVFFRQLKSMAGLKLRSTVLYMYKEKKHQ